MISLSDKVEFMKSISYWQLNVPACKATFIYYISTHVINTLLHCYYLKLNLGSVNFDLNEESDKEKSH